MLKGNKGEWSEIYTLLKLIADKQISSGDAYLNAIEGLVFPIISILRIETNSTFSFTYEQDIVLIVNGETSYRIPITEFRRQAEYLLSQIKTSQSASFQVQKTEDFIRSFKCNSIKANSSVKSDITIIIHDSRAGTSPSLGFSIKSQLGGASTLLNAARTTNFVYKIDGYPLPDETIELVNKIESRNKIQDRIHSISQNGNVFCFQKTENSIFGNNLTLIDSALPKIISEILFSYYTSSSSTMVSLLEDLVNRNPLNYDLSTSHPFYEYKIKRFLTDIALGMMPSKVWKGELDATGGHLIVKETGEIICYHIYNRNEFESYLLHNTKLETPSSTRHNFGSIYSKGQEQFFNLNLQIRFIK